MVWYFKKYNCLGSRDTNDVVAVLLLTSSRAFKLFPHQTQYCSLQCQKKTLRKRKSSKLNICLCPKMADAPMAPSDIDTLVKIITMEVLAGVDKSLEKIQLFVVTFLSIVRLNRN